MFGFIKKLFGGIFSFFGGLFGSKKSGYYMELEESKESKGSTPGTKPEAVQVQKLEPLPTQKAEPAKVSKSKATKKKQEPKPAAPAPAPAVAIASSEPTKPAPKEAAPAPKREATPVMVTPRRRPGANMTSYLDMARNMQTSSR